MSSKPLDVQAFPNLGLLQEVKVAGCPTAHIVNFQQRHCLEQYAGVHKGLEENVGQQDMVDMHDLASLDEILARFKPFFTTDLPDLNMGATAEPGADADLEVCTPAIDHPQVNQVNENNPTCFNLQLADFGHQYLTICACEAPSQTA